MLLSIIIPCFDRHELLDACMASIDRGMGLDVQVVLVDDGSKPALESVYARHAVRQDVLYRQSNRGRAAALREGLLRATGSYVLIMDSDDEFLPGAIAAVLTDLRSCMADGAVGLVYECEGFESREIIARLPMRSDMTLLGLRADAGVRGDLKEVVRRELVLDVLYPDPDEERRVPTSFLWAGVSGFGNIIARPKPIVRHRYLDGGMTKSIRKLKAANPFWLARTYLRIACAPRSSYRSRRFRFEHAVKALSVPHARLGADELGALRATIGLPTYCLAWVGAVFVRARQSL